MQLLPWQLQATLAERCSQMEQDTKESTGTLAHCACASLTGIQKGALAWPSFFFI